MGRVDWIAFVAWGLGGLAALFVLAAALALGVLLLGSKQHSSRK